MYDTINSGIENTATCHQEIDEFGYNYSRVKQNYKTYLKINLKNHGWFNMQENDQLWWSIFDGIRKFFQVGKKDNSSFCRWCSIFRFLIYDNLYFIKTSLEIRLDIHLLTAYICHQLLFRKLWFWQIAISKKCEQVGKFVKTRFNQVWKSGIQNHRSPILGNSKKNVGEYILGEDQLLKMKSPQIMSGKPDWRNINSRNQVLQYTPRVWVKKKRTPFCLWTYQ